MRHLAALTVIIALAVAGCSPKIEKFALTEGTPAFDLAKGIAEIVPEFAPGSGTVLCRAKGFEITSDEVIQAVSDNIGSQASQLTTMGADQIKNVLAQNATRIGERKVLLRAAAKAKTVLPAGALDETLQDEYNRAGGEEAFLEALKEGGVTLDHVKRNIRDGLTINQYLMDVMTARVAVTDEEVRKAYEEDKTASARHILLLTEGKTEEEKAEILKKMEGILARAKEGEDFTELAKAYSEDPGVKENDGLYSDFSRGDMVKEFEDAAFSVPVGEISGIVETRYGYHILQIVDRKRETRPLEEVRKDIELQIRQKVAPENFIQDYIEDLKVKAGFQVVELD
jgi:parvulin-like peptidyl-prolyl isomerase